MRIEDRHMAVGRCSFTVNPDRIGVDEWDILDEARRRWAHVIVFDTEKPDADISADPLGAARFTWILQARNGSTFEGMTFAGVMGNRLNRGARRDTTYSTATALSTVLGVVADNVPAVNVDATGLNTVTIDIVHGMGELEVVTAACAIAGAEWRMDPDGTLQAAAQVGSDLDVVVCESGLFIDGVQSPASIGGVQQTSEALASIVYAVNADGVSVASTSSPPTDRPRQIDGTALGLHGIVQLEGSSVGATQATNLTAATIARHNTERVRFSIAVRGQDDSWWRTVRVGDTILAHSRRDNITGTDVVDVAGQPFPATRIKIDEHRVTLTRRGVKLAWHDGTSLTVHDVTDWIDWPTEFQVDATVDTVPPGASQFDRVGFNPVARAERIPPPPPRATTGGV